MNVLFLGFFLPGLLESVVIMCCLVGNFQETCIPGLHRWCDPRLFLLAGILGWFVESKFGGEDLQDPLGMRTERKVTTADFLLGVVVRGLDMGIRRRGVDPPSAYLLS